MSSLHHPHSSTQHQPTSPPNASTPNIPPSLLKHKIISLPPSAYYIPNFLTPSEESRLLSHINAQPVPKWRVLSRRRLQAWPSELSKGNVLVKEKARGLPEWLGSLCVERILGVGVEPVQYGGDNHLSENQYAENLLLHHKEARDGSREEPASLPPPSHETQHIFHTSPHRAPNHCLINEYTPGQGIMPHEDGGAYYPVVCTITLGSHGILDLYPKSPARSEDPKDEDNSHDNVDSYGIGNGRAGGGDTQRRRGLRHRILYEPRSLLITTEELYTDYLHGIAEVTMDTDIGPPPPLPASSSSPSSGGTAGIANWDLLGDQAFWVQNGGKAERGTRVSLTLRDVLKVKEVSLGGLGKVR